MIAPASQAAVSSSRPTGPSQVACESTRAAIAGQIDIDQRRHGQPGGGRITAEPGLEHPRQFGLRHRGRARDIGLGTKHAQHARGGGIAPLRLALDDLHR